MEDILLFKEHIGSSVKIKAAGGIRTREDLEAFIQAGCSRIGTSSAVKTTVLFCGINIRSRRPGRRSDPYRWRHTSALSGKARTAVPVIRQNASPARSVPAVQQTIFTARNTASTSSFLQNFCVSSHNSLMFFPSPESDRFLFFLF